VLQQSIRSLAGKQAGSMEQSRLWTFLLCSSDVSAAVDHGACNTRKAIVNIDCEYTLKQAAATSLLAGIIEAMRTWRDHASHV